MTPQKNTRKLIIQIFIIIACIVLSIAYYFEEKDKKNKVESALLSNVVKPPKKKQKMSPQKTRDLNVDETVNSKIKEELSEVKMPEIPSANSAPEGHTKEEKENLEKSNEEFLSQFMESKDVKEEIKEEEKEQKDSNSPQPSDPFLSEFELKSTKEEIPPELTPKVEESKKIPKNEVNYSLLGKALIYNCKDLHYSCVNEESYNNCLEWESFDGSCKSIQIYKKYGDCAYIQQENIDKVVPVSCAYK